MVRPESTLVRVMMYIGAPARWALERISIASLGLMVRTVASVPSAVRVQAAATSALLIVPH